MCPLDDLALPEGRRGTFLELQLQEARAIASMFTRQDGHQIRVAFERGLALAEKVCDSKRRLKLLAEFSVFLTRIADYRTAVAIAEQGRSVTRSLDDPPHRS